MISAPRAKSTTPSKSAHRGGILTAASLMVGAPAAADAVARARRMPSLRVGLHLVLVEGRPVLPASRVSQLVDGRRWLSIRHGGARGAHCRQPRARRQLAAEITAQFEAFRAPGLTPRSLQRPQALPSPSGRSAR